jgi:hypothetical protein
VDQVYFLRTPVTCRYIQLHKHLSEDKWSPISMRHAVTKIAEQNEITETKATQEKLILHFLQVM